MGGALAWGLEPEYAVLLTALLMTVFFALLSWRVARGVGRGDAAAAAVRRQPALVRFADHGARPDEQVGRSRFRALCENLLDTTTAYLIPAGPTAALDRRPELSGRTAPVPALGSLAQQAPTRQPELILPRGSGAVRRRDVGRGAVARAGAGRRCCCSARGAITASTPRKRSRSRARPASGSSTWRPASRSPSA